MTYFSDSNSSVSFHLKKVAEVNTTFPNAIQAATLYEEQTCVLLTSEGEVLRLWLKDGRYETLWNANPPHNVQYADGGFDPIAPSTFYCDREIVVLVNDCKTHGFVWNPSQSYLLRLHREDYHANVSPYPIALYRDAEDTPHLIFSAAWNHLQIANLATRQVLTAAKSLIEEDAEERHRLFYQTQEEGNKLLWPGEFDYFFGRLRLSPNRKKLMSLGWAWGSCDSHLAFEIEDFLKNPRIRYSNLFCGEHLGRSACFITDEMVAIPYYPSLDGDEDTESNRWQILLCDFQGNEIRRILLQASWNLGKAEMVYHSATQCLLLFSQEIGLAALSLDGSIRLHEKTVVPQRYEEAHDCFLCYGDHDICVYQIVNP